MNGALTLPEHLGQAFAPSPSAPNLFSSYHHRGTHTVRSLRTVCSCSLVHETCSHVEPVADLVPLYSLQPPSPPRAQGPSAPPGGPGGRCLGRGQRCWPSSHAGAFLQPHRGHCILVVHPTPHWHQPTAQLPTRTPLRASVPS